MQVQTPTLFAMQRPPDDLEVQWNRLPWGTRVFILEILYVSMVIRLTDRYSTSESGTLLKHPVALLQ